MATLALTRVFVNLLSTGAAISAQSQQGRGVQYAQDAEVRTYAGGRMRAIARAGVKATYTATLRMVPRADVDTLKSWICLPVQVRDNQGRLIVGVFFDVAEVEWASAPGLYDVPLTVQLITDPGL